MGEGVRGTISISEFEGPAAKVGDYFEAEIIDFENDISVLAWGEVIPTYEIKPYSFVRAEVVEIKGSTVLLQINKYRTASMSRDEIDGGSVSIGDTVEAEVIDMDDGYLILSERSWWLENI